MSRTDLETTPASGQPLAPGIPLAGPLADMRDVAFGIVGASLLLLLTSCSDRPSSELVATPSPNGDPSEPTYGDHWTPTQPAPRGSASLGPESASAGDRVAHRLSVDQVRRSVPALFGGETWTVGNGRNTSVGFDALARTLGEPDYIQSTTNNLDASPLFAKYMDDMAGDVCNKAVTRDRGATSPSEKLVVRHPTDVDQNLRFLRLKLHGILVPDGSTAGLDELRSLYEAVTRDAGGDVNQGWFAVCVAMLTAPEFMAY